MTTTFIPSRELSASPGRVLRRLRRAAPTVITANGKPVALMVGTSEQTIEADLRQFGLRQFAQAVEAMRSASNGRKPLTMQEINAEIKNARNARKKTNMGD